MRASASWVVGVIAASAVAAPFTEPINWAIGHYLDKNPDTVPNAVLSAWRLVQMVGRVHSKRAVYRRCRRRNGRSCRSKGLEPACWQGIPPLISIKEAKKLTAKAASGSDSDTKLYALQSDVVRTFSNLKRQLEAVRQRVRDGNSINDRCGRGNSDFIKEMKGYLNGLDNETYRMAHVLSNIADEDQFKFFHTSSVGDYFLVNSISVIQRCRAREHTK